MTVRARDVALAAQVSVSTVSRALARPHQVAPDTLEKVLATARVLGYRPNPFARSLTTGRTGNLGMVVPDLENPFFASVAKGVQSRARAAGCATFVADSEEDADQESELVRTLSKQVDGILLCSPRAHASVLAELALECNLVLVNRRCGDIPAVAVDNHEGMRQAYSHLRALGHRRVAYVGGPTRSWSNDQRLAALRTLAAAHPDTELLDLGCFAPYVSGGVAAGDLVVASGATAVVAFNDMVALGLLARLVSRGCRVPGEISVVGVDDIVVSSLTNPPLTTVRLPVAESGRAGVDLLLSIVQQRAAPPPPLLLETHLVVRGSTGPHGGPGARSPT